MTEQEAIKAMQVYSGTKQVSPIPIEATIAAGKALETVQNMKERGITQETILEYARFEDECVKKGFTFKSLLKAREKQIPQKPARQKDKNFGYHEKCPVCGSFGIVKYCCECGQKIDRGGTNE